jgi:uncharacterized protein YbaR (Trm112 family)
MTVDPQLVEILVCPETRRPVRLASAEELARVNAGVGRGTQRPRRLPGGRRHPLDADRGIDPRLIERGLEGRPRYCANSRFFSSRTYSLRAGSEATSWETRDSNSAALRSSGCWSIGRSRS